MKVIQHTSEITPMPKQLTFTYSSLFRVRCLIKNSYGRYWLRQYYKGKKEILALELFVIASDTMFVYFITKFFFSLLYPPGLLCQLCELTIKLNRIRFVKALLFYVQHSYPPCEEFSKANFRLNISFFVCIKNRKKKKWCAMKDDTQMNADLRDVK